MNVTLIQSRKSGSIDNVIISLDGNMYPIWNIDIIQYNAWDILNKIG